MTAEVDVHREVSEVEEKCSYQDLHKDNGVVVNGNGNGNTNKDDADGSYVFVSGSDAVSDDHVEPSDLGEEVHGENVGSENIKVKSNGGSGVLEGSECEIIEEIVKEAVVESEPSEPQRHHGEVEAGAEVEERIEVKGEESSVDVRGLEDSNVMDSEAADCECESTQVDDGKAVDGSTEEVVIIKESQVSVTNSAESGPSLEDNNLDLIEEVEIIQEPQVSVTNSAESDPSLEDNNIDLIEEVEIIQEPQVLVTNSAESEPSLEDNNLDLIEEVEIIQEPQVLVTNSAESEPSLEDNNLDLIEEVEIIQEPQVLVTDSAASENNLESNEKVEVIQESQVSVTNSAESEPPSEIDGGERVEEERKLDSATDWNENEESQNMVTVNVQNDLDLDKGTPELTNEVPLEGAPVGPGLELEQKQKQRTVVNETDLETEINDGSVSVDNGDGLPANQAQDNPSETVDADQKIDEQNGCSENGESFPSPLVCGNDAANEIPVEADTGEHDVDLEQNSEKASCQVATREHDVDLERNSEKASCQVATREHDVDLEQNSEEASCQVADDTPLEPEVVNGPVSDENGDCLATDHAQDIISENLANNDLVGASENTPEQNGSSKDVECLLSPVESGESLPTAPDNDTAVEVDAGNEASPITESIPTCVAEDDTPETEVGNLDANRSRSPDSCPADDTKLEIKAETSPDETIKAENGPDSCPADETKLEIKAVTSPDETFKAENGPDSCPADDTKLEIKAETSLDETIKAENGPDYSILSSHDDNARSETDTGSVAIDSEEKVSDHPSDAMKIESRISNTSVDCADGLHHSVAATDVESHTNGLAENESDLSTSLGADVKSESEVENTSSLSSRDMSPCDAGLESESKVLDGSANVSESALNCVPDVVQVEDGGEQLTSTDSGDKPAFQGTEGIAGIHGDETSTTSPEGSTVDALEGQNAELVKRPFYYLIRLPRHDDENIKEQIKHAQFLVNEKTQSRDAIRAEIQMKRATWMEHRENLDAAKSEERAARDLLRSKRQEMDSVQSKINIVKNAINVEDIGARIRNMEHAIQHETLPLKEEKQLLHEIRQLKQHREQLSSNTGRQDDVQQALDQKDQIEEHMKVLRKELDVLRDNFQKAEAVTKAAKKKFNDESDKMNELQARFKAADDIRQEAYSHQQSLKKQLNEKNKHFWNYRDDVKVATDLALKGEREELQRLCVNQVEKVMELWNKNDEFRKEYIRCNTRSTLRRLRTLDGRSLGPNEEPPLIPTVFNERVIKGNSVSLQSAVEQEKQNVQVETEKVKEKPMVKAFEQKNQTTKSKKPVKPDLLGNGLATVSGRDEIEEAKEEESKLTKEEEELARKAEELRREEEAAKLKEQRKLEEKAKAIEALERKKRNAEKAQARALLRAQKEAEQKEKEREKKARKKERKKTGVVEVTDVDEGEIAPSLETATETPSESETREKPMTVTKRSQKPSQFTKQTKAKSIPPPLRNRGKRRMQTWMWVLLAAVVVFALFLVGNSSFSFNFGLQRFGF